MGQGSHHGGDAFLYQFTEHLTVGAVYIANESEVDTILKRSFVTADDIHVGTCKPQGIDTVGLQTGHEVLVYQTAIDHCHHTEHVGIGDATAIHHLRLDAQGFGNLRSLAAATMHQNFLAGDGAEVFEQL